MTYYNLALSIFLLIDNIKLFYIVSTYKLNSIQLLKFFIFYIVIEFNWYTLIV